MRYKKPKEYYPRPFPEPGWVQSLAHGLAYENDDIPRRHEKWFWLADPWMDRPVGVVSEKNWKKIIQYLFKAQHAIFERINSWPRRRIPRYRRIPPCRNRGWTWSRKPLVNLPSGRRRRFILPSLVPTITGPPARALTPLGEGRPCRREPETVAALPLVG